MRVDEAGQDREVVALDDRGAIGNAYRRTRSHGRDPVVLDHDDGRLDRVAPGAVDQAIGDDGDWCRGHGHVTNRRYPTSPEVASSSNATVTFSSSCRSSCRAMLRNISRSASMSGGWIRLRGQSLDAHDVDLQRVQRELRHEQEEEDQTEHHADGAVELRRVPQLTLHQLHADGLERLPADPGDDRAGKEIEPPRALRAQHPEHREVEPDAERGGGDDTERAGQE